jgi:Mg-chelatase subunit ChlD
MMMTPTMRILSLLGGTGLTLACSNPAELAANDRAQQGGGSDGAAASAGSLSVNLDGGLGAGGQSQAGGETCATSSAEVELTPLDMALGVDTSYSMDFDDKWSQVRGALKVFAHNPNYANMGVSLQFFPVRQQCNVALYGEPDVAMQVLPEVAPAFSSAVDAQRMFGGTPLVQVIQGMLGYLRGWASSHPGRKPVMVLATDGIPDDTCSASDIDPPNSLENAVALAQTAYTGQPSIPVFVIGVGAELSALNGIAEAGGTGAAAVISTGGNVTQKFLAALDAIRVSALSCEYEIPPPSTGKIDFEAVNVAFQDGSAAADTFFYVEDAAGCSASPDQSWYYDDSQKPRKVVLCPKTCERVSAASTAKVNIAFGCKRNNVR